MANKYSRYELQPFPSLYVDNKHPEIAQLLAQRYDANKTSKDLIDRTLSQLELLDGDKAHLERVKTEVKGTLKDHIEKQDWENSSLVVHDAAQLVETDSGLIAANKSMQNRQAEINAMREAKLNGIPMLDFGADSRKSHQSYYYNEEAGTYVTNIYEPMMEQQLNYRERKEAMIGKIPVSQRGAWRGIGRGQTNKTANLLLDQYITDTKEGAQEYRKLIEIDLPQSLPLEERIKMAKAHILEDFREVAQQQEFDQVASTKGDGSGTSGYALKDGITIKSSQDTEINTAYDNVSDKIRTIQERNMVINRALGEKGIKQSERDALTRELANNDQMVDQALKNIANRSEEGKNALVKYNRIRERFGEFGEDGQRLLAATQYLTYNTYSGDTDWGNIWDEMLIGGVGAATIVGIAGQAGPQIVAPEEVISVPVGFVAGMGFGAMKTGIDGIMLQSFRNVRDLGRRQEPLLHKSLGDSERDQLQEELFQDEDLKDMSVDYVNRILGTEFEQKDMEELSKMTNAYYTFMTHDKMKDENGAIVDRMSGDDLFDAATNETFTLNQQTLGFDMTDAGKKLRTSTNSFVQSELNLNNAGIQFDGMVGNKEINTWIDEEVKGANNLTLEGIVLPDIPANLPLRLTFGSKTDASGSTNRSAYVTDPTVLQPGGWVHDLIDKNFGSGDKVYNEIIRRSYEDRGYENVTMDEYSSDLADKAIYYNQITEEDKLEYKRVIENQNIMSMLVSSDFDFEHYDPFKNGNRGIIGQTGFIPFMLNKGTVNESFNMAAWEELQNRPAELQGLRTQLLTTSLQDFAGTDF